MPSISCIPPFKQYMNKLSLARHTDNVTAEGIAALARHSDQGTAYALELVPQMIRIYDAVGKFEFVFIFI